MSYLSSMFEDFIETGKLYYERLKHGVEEIYDQTVDKIDHLNDQAIINFYGETTSCVEEQLSRSHFVLTISEFLERFKQNIIDSARENKIDGRAVAAVIAWEFEENLRGRFSDYLQLLRPGETDGLGWGSMHTQEALKMLPKGTTVEESACIRMDAASLIPLVAQFMKRCIDIFFEHSGGVYIGNDPAIVAYFYNTGQEKAESSGKKWIYENAAKGPLITLQKIKINTPINPMSKWVDDNIERFKRFRTEPVENVPNDLKYTILIEKSGTTRGSIYFVSGCVNLQTECWYKSTTPIQNRTTYTGSATYMKTKKDSLTGQDRPGIFIKEFGKRGIFIHEGKDVSWSDNCIVLKRYSMMTIWNYIVGQGYRDKYAIRILVK